MDVIYETNNGVKFNFNTIEIYNKDNIKIIKGMNKIELLKIDLPIFYEGFLLSCLNHLGLIFPSSQGTIDWDYKKEVGIFLWSEKDLLLKANTLIARIVLRPVDKLIGQTEGSAGKDMVLQKDVSFKPGEIQDLYMESTGEYGM